MQVIVPGGGLKEVWEHSSDEQFVNRTVITFGSQQSRQKSEFCPELYDGKAPTVSFIIRLNLPKAITEMTTNYMNSDSLSVLLSLFLKRSQIAKDL